MTCRDEILSVAQRIVSEKGKNEFTIGEVLDEMKETRTSCQESTIRTHVTSRMCRNAPKNHAVVYDDFYRIRRGVYSIIK